MSSLRLILGDRRRRQRGSVLSGLLIMVAMLAILVGALMTDLSSSFLLSRAATVRVEREATVSSAMEWGLFQLQNSAVPHVCVRDGRGPWFVNSINGSAAAVTQACTGIVPDASVGLAGGAYTIDGTYVGVGGHNSYLFGSQGGRLVSYSFGTTTVEWTADMGGALTGQAMAAADPESSQAVALLVPNAGSSSSCGGHCVSLYVQGTGAATHVCDMAAATLVSDQPASEMSGGGRSNFPAYVFFGDSGGNLYVYDASTDGSCSQQARHGGLGGAVAGQPLVFPGTTSSRGSTLVDDVFVVVTSSSSTALEHWQYSESTDGDGGGAPSLTLVSTLTLAVGGNAVVSDPSSTVPSGGTAIRQAVVGRGGRIVISRINVSSTRSGFTYTASLGPAATLGGPVSHQPYWCHCPGGDTIGVGSTNGYLYLLDTNLNVSHQYDGQADGRPAINSTPTADSNGDWYFGADDGNTYDVEIPATGLQMFKAARFGPGGAVRSSPIAGACGTATCIYFASTTSGAYFVNVATTRIIDLRSCLSSGPGSTTCTANPRLWARVIVGPPAVVGGKGIAVQGWSFYSP